MRAVGLALLALVLAVLATGCGRSHRTHTAHTGTGFATLTAQRCSTSEAIAQHGGPLPPSVQMPMPSASAGKLTAYADTAGTLLPAPTGWSCTAFIGADGTSRMSVYPPGQKDPLTSPRGSPSGVTLQLLLGCQGCVHDVVCALFPNAKIVRTYAKFGGTCPPRNPTAQETHGAGHNVVLFRDPPGVKGQGDPSGGGIAAIGGVELTDQFGNTGASAVQVTCAIRGDPDTCAAIASATLATAPR